jgi:RNA polymerase I-specific transcription initiation factor RRN3
MLIKYFSFVNSNDGLENGANISGASKYFNCQAMYDFSHNIINHLIKLVPSCKVHIPKLFDNLFPYMSKETIIQEAYVTNLLKIAENISELRLILLEIFVQKLLKIDVSCQREQIISAESNEDFSQPSLLNVTTTKHLLAAKLDCMMLCLFEFIQKNCTEGSLVLMMEEKNENLKFNWDFCKTIYKDILFCFDKYILTTYGSSHVQFIMFYICSFRSMLSEGFLDYLWKKFVSPNTCSVSKAICCYYIGSFLARYKIFVKKCTPHFFLRTKSLC